MTDWSDVENLAAVRAYFEMFSLRRSGTDFKKIAFARRVAEETGRSCGAVEYKFQNLSAVLSDKGFPWLDGFKPAANYQSDLAEPAVAAAKSIGLRPKKRRRHESGWRKNTEVTAAAKELSGRCLAAYEANPKLVEEHLHIELATAQGGYGRRQVYELVQNGADAMLNHDGGRIQIVLTNDSLYCANEGAPISVDGVEALLHSHISLKRGAEIGRYGLGFKSVLGVCDAPRFFSRSGSFGFQSEWARDQIRRILPGVDRTPILRLAKPLDPQLAAAADPVLRGLMKWADTVVHLPLGKNRADWLAEDLASFPREFLLFSPHVGSLDLDDLRGGRKRRIHLLRGGKEYELREAGKSSFWKVFSTEHECSDAARLDAGELAHRAVIPLIWAVPTRGRPRSGQFWAFFPTEYETTLSGILNAPWKTNEDRQNLLTGTFNEELIASAARLVVQSLGELTTVDDPGAHLDRMPARGREARNWADKALTEATYATAADCPAIPNADGVLTKPSELLLHPPDLGEAALAAWHKCPSRPRNWCHPSVETRERRPRVERLKLIGKQTWDRPHTTLKTWLEDLADSGGLESSAAAVRAAASLVKEGREKFGETVRGCYIASAINAGDGLARPDPETLFLPVKGTAGSTDVAVVDPDLLELEGVLTALSELGLASADPSALIRTILAKDPEETTDEDWQRLWAVSRRLPGDRACRVMEGHEVQALTATGEFCSIRSLLLPGRVIPQPTGPDARFCVDAEYHKADMVLLGKLGVSGEPEAGEGSLNEDWFDEYLWMARQEFLKFLPSGSSRPQPHYLQFREDEAAFGICGPLSVMRHLSSGAAARFCAAVLSRDAGAPDWVMRHDTQTQKYPELAVLPPSLWLVANEGHLPTSLGPIPTSDCVAGTFAEWTAFLPVTELSDVMAARLNVPCLAEDLKAGHWRKALAQADSTDDDLLRSRFYAFAAELREAPKKLTARVGADLAAMQPGEAFVVAKNNQAEALRREQKPYLIVSTQAEQTRLVERWGLSAPDSVVHDGYRWVASGPCSLLGDEFPGLNFVARHLRDYELVACEALDLVTETESGSRSVAHEKAVVETTVLYRKEIQPYELLSWLSRHFSLSLSESQLTALIDERQNEEVRRNRARVAKAASLGLKLVAAIGAPAIKSKLPSSLLDAVGELYGELSDERLGEVALATFGLNALKEFSDELEANGLQPPSQWAGRANAVSFAKSIGFDAEYAGFEGRSRPAHESVDGPVTLPELHDFQDHIRLRLRDVLTSDPPQRGLMSLPTGAGKTRVAVQAVVESIREQDLHGPILWVAQTDELCEQAALSWAEVWRSLGPQRRMDVSRLWSSNEVAQRGSEAFQVVIATIAKLGHVVEQPEYQWLGHVECAFIDEAHTSITKEYTKLLHFLGAERGRTARPVVGLTATPFRGTSEEETRRLVARYEGNRLDEGAFGSDGLDPYIVLQRKRVLAQVRHRILAGVDISLDDDELELLERTRRLPTSVEQRLGGDVSRNTRLLKSIRALPDDWPVLLFAASVENAQTLAALLRLEGIAAAAVSAATEPGARKTYIEQFRAGEMRVLTNFGVLTQGFDAPKVRAVYVARPTFSPNLYQQMIGRGLRGPLNGGSEECLIVNVEDNVLRYGHDLAFRGFEHLWTAAE